MKVTEYEKTYTSVYNAVNDVRHVEAVVEFLRKQTAPATCAEIGKGVFGDVYSRSYMSKSYAAQMGQVLRHLRKGGFIKVEERKGDPIEIEVEEYIVPEDENGEPPMLTVHDEQGREFRIDNPNYNRMNAWRRGHWGRVKKTVTPTIKTYLWVAE